MAAITCATSRTDKALFGIASVFTGTLALSSFDNNLWCAIPATVCTVFLVIAAITGYCPTGIIAGLSRSRHGSTQNEFGIPEARGAVKTSRR